MKIWYNISMKKTDLAYVAGIIDGEGWIRIHNRKIKNGNQNYALQVGVGMTNECLINWLKFCFGGSVLQRNQIGNRKTRYDWALATKQAGDFLKLVLPYLKIKRPQAELALKFQSRRRYRGNPNWKDTPKRTMSDEDLALDISDKILMHKYNRRGIE